MAATAPPWLPSPSIRALMENTPMHYLMGNTTYRDVLSRAVPYGEAFSSSQHSNKDGQLEALFLGCGDIRNVLCTAMAVANVPGALTLHLNDINLGVIARDALLLSIAQRINPDSAEDVQYCGIKAHAPRLQDDMQRMIDGGSDRFLSIPREQDRQQVTDALQAWLRGPLPSYHQVKRQREKLGMMPQTIGRFSMFEEFCTRQAAMYPFMASPVQGETMLKNPPHGKLRCVVPLECMRGAF
eukprot:jgi/Chlat1/5976/Chrsp4S06294